MIGGLVRAFLWPGGCAMARAATTWRSRPCPCDREGLFRYGQVLRDHYTYIAHHGVDLPAVRDWSWTG